MHFPVGSPENSPVKFRHLHDVYNEKLLEIFSEYADVIFLGLFGHQHTDSYRVFEVKSAGKTSYLLPTICFVWLSFNSFLRFSLDKAKNGTLIPLFFTPSISPMFLQNLGGFLPRIRIFNFSLNSAPAPKSPSPSFEVHDFRQFYANISSTLAFPWNLEYIATEAYNLPNLSGTNLKSLQDRFENNQTVWCAYWNHELGIGRPHESGPCPELRSKRHCRHMCSLRHVHYEALDGCLSYCSKINEPSVTSQQNVSDDNWNAVPIIILVIVAFLAILIGVVLLANRELCRRKRGSRRSRRRLDFNERRGTYLISYRQPGLNGVTLRRSALDEEGLVGLGNGFRNEELKALNVEEPEEAAYDADASEDEDEIPVEIPPPQTPVGSSKGDFYAPSNGSIERLNLIDSENSTPLFPPGQVPSLKKKKNHDVFGIEHEADNEDIDMVVNRPRDIPPV